MQPNMAQSFILLCEQAVILYLSWYYRLKRFQKNYTYKYKRELPFLF